jgi:hypothetical protein
MEECERLISQLFNKAVANLDKSVCLDEIKKLLVDMAKAATQREK